MMWHDRPMRRVLLIGAGALLVLIGLVWTGQGLGWIAGSPMTGVTLWAVIGPIVVVAGAALSFNGLRNRG
jgi:sulfite exporter TauE/SafE